jgi:hypothetical protein
MKSSPGGFTTSNKRFAHTGRVDDACTPDGVEIGEGLFRDSLLGGFSRGLQFLNAITCSDKHVSVFREVRFVAERAVPRNNLGVIVGERGCTNGRNQISNANKEH